MKKKMLSTVILFLIILFPFAGVPFTAEASETEQTIVTEDGTKTEPVNGVLVCGNCKAAPAVLHSTDCTLMPGCQASGYGILVPQENKSYKFYKFDQNGDALAYSFLSKLKEDGIDSYLTVKVQGELIEEAGTYSYSYVNKSGITQNENYSYDGKITNAINFEYDKTHAEFEHFAKPVSSGSISIAAIPKQAYTGKAIEPALVITDGDYVLQYRKDYLLEYSNHTQIGTATVKVKGVTTIVATTSNGKSANCKVVVRKK